MRAATARMGGCRWLSVKGSEIWPKSGAITVAGAMLPH